MQPGSKRALAPTLRVGQHLELLFDGLWYATRLEDLSPEALCVAWPTDARRCHVPIEPGHNVQLAASADARYSATCTVVGVQEAPVPLVTIQLDGEWQRAQRRNDVRARVAIKPSLIDRIAGDHRTPLRAGVTDLSAGGLRLRSQDELRPGDTVELAFGLMGATGELLLTARVERVERADRGPLAVWEAGCAFVEQTPRVTDQIVKFIFAQQRALASARRSQP
jgi:c-di-GMP-binding flagellar brake protein YcgR